MSGYEPEITGSYTVTGRNAVHGHKTGETFTLTATRAQIGALVIAGHIRPASQEG